MPSPVRLLPAARAAACTKPSALTELLASHSRVTCQGALSPMRGSGRLSLPVRVHRGSLGAPRRPTKEEPAGLTRVPSRVPWCRPSWHRPSRLGVVSRSPEVCTAPPEVSTFSSFGEEYKARSTCAPRHHRRYSGCRKSVGGRRCTLPQHRYTLLVGPAWQCRLAYRLRRHRSP